MRIYYTENFTGGREESHRLLKEALCMQTGDEEQAKKLIGTLKKGEHGKPYIEGFCCFSVSHTGSIWAALFADRECGLDIQLSRKCDIMAISERFFAVQDAEIIASEGSPAKAHDTFFRAWTRREALVKALGTTVYDPELPNVLSGKAEAGGRKYSIADIGPFVSLQLYAAICVEGSISDQEPEIYHL